MKLPMAMPVNSLSSYAVRATPPQMRILWAGSLFASPIKSVWCVSAVSLIPPSRSHGAHVGRRPCSRSGSCRTLLAYPCRDSDPRCLTLVALDFRRHEMRVCACAIAVKRVATRRWRSKWPHFSSTDRQDVPFEAGSIPYRTQVESGYRSGRNARDRTIRGPGPIALGQSNPREGMGWRDA
eukprot:scaffold519_cov331-Pavlova_lutheri.AAC.41